MDQGFILADDSPKALMENMGANVLELTHPNLRQVKDELLEFSEVRSAAQIGARLRVLVDDKVNQPDIWLKQALPTLEQSEIHLTPPNLEDVFVTVTEQSSALEIG